MEQFRHRRFDPIFQKPKSKQHLPKLAVNSSLELPRIYTKQVKNKIP